MTEVQRRAAVAGFIHALKTSPDVLKEWVATPKHDDKAIGALIQKTLGLAQAPNRADIEAMEKHADEALEPHVKAAQESAGVPRSVGFFLATQS
ncbi:MAG: hypothetical protein NVSMB31_11620 [Vulcanimicrobiaceae bacterium]